MAKSRIKALIQLIDDPDQTVYEIVEKEILNQKPDIISDLEEIWDSTNDEVLQIRIENLIQKFQFRETKKKFMAWAASSKNSILKGFEIVTRYQYPDLNFAIPQYKFEKLRKEIWLELSHSLTALEKVTVLNHILFTVHKFSVDLENPDAPRNCFMNQLFESRKGNPVSVCILYLTLAQSLDLPIKFIPFPKNPLLAYVDHDLAVHTMGKNTVSDVIFYINPANRGSITGRKELEYHLKKNNYLPVEKYIEPILDRYLILRLLETLMKGYEKNNQQEHADNIRELSAILRKALK